MLRAQLDTGCILPADAAAPLNPVLTETLFAAGLSSKTTEEQMAQVTNNLLVQRAARADFSLL